MRTHLALLSAALLAPALARAEGGCPVEAFDALPSAPAALAASDPLCAKASALLPDFERLRAAAGVPESIPLRVDVSAGANHRGRYWGSFLSLKGWFMRSPVPDDRFRAVIAHELAHAVQARGPESREKAALREKLLPRLSVGEAGAWEEWWTFGRRYEAQADGIAQQILRKAGYPDAAYHAFFECSRTGKRGAEHPSFPVTRLNMALVQEYLALLSRTEVEGAYFDGSAIRIRGPEPEPGDARLFRPAIPLSRYDAEGRFMREGVHASGTPGEPLYREVDRLFRPVHDAVIQRAGENPSAFCPVPKGEGVGPVARRAVEGALRLAAALYSPTNVP